MQLTDRQQLLFNRLVTLGDWATHDELPLRVLEIRGFGSFFRGKPRPSDVDLILRVQHPRQLPEFDRFITLLKSVRNDWDLEERFPTPHEALVALRSEGDERCLDASEDEYRKFLNWIEPYSWKMLRPNTLSGQISFKAPEGYANRMVKKHLPNLNIILFQNADDTEAQIPGLHCGFTVSVWSKESPDSTANLLSLLSAETVASNLLREVAYFNVQIPKVEALTRLYEAEITLLNRTSRRRKPASSDGAWLKEFTKGHANLKEFQQQLEAAENAADRFDKEEWGRCPQISLTSLVQTAKEADQARKKLKQLYQRNDMLEALRNQLAFFKSGCAQTDLPAEEYVVDDLLREGSQKKKEEMAVFLRSLGYPVERVLQRNERELMRRRRRAAEGFYDAEDTPS